MKKAAKKLLPVFFSALVLMGLSSTAKAESPFSMGYHHRTGGFVYSNTQVPEFLPKEPNFKAIPQNNTVNVSNKRNDSDDEDSKPTYAGLKKGIASSINVMDMVEVGNAGIMEACKNGNISRIYFVDSKKERLWAYYFYYEKLTTIVYGE